MKSKFLLLALTSVIFTGCSTMDNNNNQQNVRYDSSLQVSTSEEDIVSGEILKTIFDNNASAFQKNVSAFCINVGTEDSVKDPSIGLLSIFSTHKPRVLPASECNSKTGEVFDKSGKRAIIFHISNLNKNADGSYEAEAGYYEGNLSSQTNRYSAKKVSGKWVVNLVEMGPVS